MTASKSLSLITLAIFVGSASAWLCDPWSPPIYKDIDGTGMCGGGTHEWSLDQCKTRCINAYGCKTAQFSQFGSYNGLNCFLYNNQNFNNDQLFHGGGWFQSYKYEEDPWSGPIYRDIDGTGMGGTREWNLHQCKSRCINTHGCKTAQFSQVGSYNDLNCFLYNNQNFNRDQLQHGGGWFQSYKYEGTGLGGTREWNLHQCVAGTWSDGIYSDIQGTGLGGTWVYDLAACKQRCAHTDFCQAAQFSTGRLYYNSCNAYGHSGCNCFIYTNQNDNKVPGADIPDFYLYKYYPNGNSNRRRWSRRLGESTDNAVVTV